jgi:hypothetical protein
MGSRPPDANLSRHIRANTGSTRSSRVNTHRRSSRTVSPAKARTGSNQHSGLPNHLP